MVSSVLLIAGLLVSLATAAFQNVQTLQELPKAPPAPKIRPASGLKTHMSRSEIGRANDCRSPSFFFSFFSFFFFFFFFSLS
jgi:hypothetical protein